MEKERLFRLSITFDKKDSNMFGGLSNQSVVIDVSEDIRNRLIDQFHSQDGTLSVSLESGITRHINVRNILYIDDVEIKELKSEEVNK